MRVGRFGVFSTIIGVLSTLLVVVVPGVAQAGAIVPCPDTITEWKIIRSVPRLGHIWQGYRYTLHTVTPVFLVSDGRVLVNTLDEPATYSVSSAVSQTFRVSSSVGVDAKVGDFLTTKVSTTIEASRTTQIGVNVSTVVPPRSRVIAEYGVEGYYVTYAIEAWQAAGRTQPQPGARCEEWGYYPQSTNAPTIYEGWRLRAG